MKGSYGGGRLPVARSYTPTDKRTRLLLAGGAGALAVLAFFGGRALLGDRGPLSPGPLSAAHADLQCGSCHRAFEDAVSMTGQCIDCHDPTVELEVGDDVIRASRGSQFSLQAHARRIRDGAEAEGGWNCTTCHTEHDGTSPQRLADGCVGCHDVAPFADNHPQFEVLRPDPAAVLRSPADELLFEHPEHVKVALDRGQAPSAEASCLLCHEPEDRGVSFAAISFDQHCADCHLDGGQATGWLPVAGSRSRVSMEQPGVLVAEQFAAQVPPPLWLRDLAEGDLRRRRDSVRRVGLRHADPWVVDNLRRLREAVEEQQGGAPLGDLFDTTVDADSRGERRRLTSGALDQLRSQLETLRQLDDPALATELAALEKQLRAAERRINQGEALTAGELERSPADVIPEPVAALAQQLLAECVTCHTLDGLRLRAIDPQLEVLHAARFDHDAHLLTGTCQGCHEGMTEESVIAADAPAATDSGEDPSVSPGQGGTHHLPGVVVCQECHQAERAGESCDSCHWAHPEKPAAGRFLRHIMARSAGEEAEPAPDEEGVR